MRFRMWHYPSVFILPLHYSPADVGNINNEVTIEDLKIVNAKVGENITVSFTINIKKESDLDGQVNLTMTDNRGNEIPCVLGIGTW